MNDAQPASCREYGERDVIRAILEALRFKTEMEFTRASRALEDVQMRAGAQLRRNQAMQELFTHLNGDYRERACTPPPEVHLMSGEPAIIRLPWHKEPDGDFWRAEVIGHVYEVHDDELADYKKRQCQYDFEARVRSVLVPAALATTEGSDNAD